KRLQVLPQRRQIMNRYQKVNRIKQFNFQINRVLTYGEEACDEELVIQYLSGVRTIEGKD
ncbi:MAG: hypothetical protein K5668_08655, partial [Lachnospiraceae bacterium]|nr:hypothetical protein [Lachnospiraceae bacterium]